MKKVIWTLTNEEKSEIEELFERKLALENLSKIIDPSNEILYEKIIADYGKVINLFNSWWNIMSCKYSWEGKKWMINFETNEVILQ